MKVDRGVHVKRESTFPRVFLIEESGGGTRKMEQQCFQPSPSVRWVINLILPHKTLRNVGAYSTSYLPEKKGRKFGDHRQGCLAWYAIYDAGLGHPFTAFVRTESLGLSRIFRQHLFALYVLLDVVMLLPMHKHLQCRDVDAQLS